jgi:hypothetical protein
MSCESLDSLLAEIDDAIANYSYIENHGYIDHWKKKISAYRTATEDLNRQTDALIKERARSNGGLTRGVRG